MSTKNGLSVAAIVPAYNEENYIENTIDEIKNSKLVDHIIVVDDGSTDRTSELAMKKDVILLRHKSNGGVGEAIKTGFKKALELDADVSVIMAGDGQMSTTELPKFLKKCEEGYGLVIGNRFAEIDPREYGMPNIRYYGAKILALMTYVATGKWVPDSQNGYTAFRREALEKMDVHTIYNHWGVHNDIISRCAVKDVPIALVPQKPKYFSENGERIKSEVWVFNIIIPNIRIFFKSLLRRVKKSVGLEVGL